MLAYVVMEICKTKHQAGDFRSPVLGHTFCFFVRHPLHAPLIRDGILFERGCQQCFKILGG